MKQYTNPESVIHYTTATTTVVAGNLMMATSAGAPVVGADTAGAHCLGLAIADYDGGVVRTITGGDIILAVDADAELGQELYIISATEGTHTGSSNTVKIGWLVEYVISLSDHTPVPATQAGAGFARVRLDFS
ncbi:MAG: hypothetical protein GY832_31025 [Chloroflexi bacterium]|nr:hypothetical protein [Chloroflexota bacterium]